jgi:hypothetical protein
MIRFSLLQFRAQAIVAGAGLVIAAIVLAATGLHLAHLYDSSAFATCLGTACTRNAASFLNKAASYASLGRFLGFVVLGVPAVIGLFWGAPLVAREIETHTDRLAWTQGVTRSRWIAVKLAVVGVASVAVTGLLSLMVTWWASPIDKASMYRWSAFDQRDIVPVAYAAFAFTLGVAAGALIRRTLPAMAVALVVFIAAQLLITVARPHYIAPLRATPAISLASLQGTGVTGNGRLFIQPAQLEIAGAWILSPSLRCAGTAQCDVITSNGGSAANLPATRACHTSAPLSGPRSCDAYLATLHLRQLVTYQPAGRFWVFQWIETAIYAALAIVLAFVSFFQVRRRIT